MRTVGVLRTGSGVGGRTSSPGAREGGSNEISGCCVGVGVMTGRGLASFVLEMFSLAENIPGNAQATVLAAMTSTTKAMYTRRLRKKTFANAGSSPDTL